MKKIILLLFFVHLTMVAFCQTVTILDLKKLSNGGDAEKILIPKSFKIIGTKYPHKKIQTFYVINYHTPKAESIQIGPDVTSKDGTTLHDVTYITKDTNYVNRIMKQVNMCGIKPVGKKAQKAQTTYTFDSKKLFVQVVINKNNTLQSTVELRNKP